MHRPLVLFVGLVVFANQTARIRFVNVTEAAGIRAVISNGHPERNWIPEANGNGVAWLDYNNDGLLDLLIVNGASMEVFARIAKGEIPPARDGGVFLYRNTGDGKFQDVTSVTGLANSFWGTGANAADFDNDGYVDILITTIGRDLLYKNNRDGTFRDVSKDSGLTQQMHWHTGSAFGDYDGDGHLDLYIAGYVALDALSFSGKAPVCSYRGVPGFCGPMGLKGEPDILYHANGDGTFREVTAEAGVTDRKLGHGFGVLFHDFNGDGRPDIFVANDSDPNYLYLNQGSGKFREAAMVSGVGFNSNGQTMANMGIALGDYDGDGKVDVLTTVFSEDYFPLFRQTQPGFYDEVSSQAGLSTLTLPWVGWACGFTDFNNDGKLELWTSNGHVYPKADLLPTSSYLQPFVVLENRQGQFKLVSDLLDKPQLGSYRGAAAGDFDNDGRVDIVVLPVEGSPMLLRNETNTNANWIGLRLEGKSSNRDGLGAIVHVNACEKVQTQAMVNAGSYLSRNDPRLHFGIGACTGIDNVTVSWPSGKKQTLNKPHVNAYHVVREAADPTPIPR